MCLLKTKLFHADGWTDGQTDMTKQIVAFRNYANASKMNNNIDRNWRH